MAGFKLKRFFNYDDNFFGFNITYLMLVGLWPDKNWSRNQKICYKIYEIILHVLGATFLTFSGVGIYSKIGDTTIVLSNLDKCLAAYNFELKIIVFLFKRDRIRNLVEEMIASGDVVKEDRKALIVKLSATSAIITTMIVSTFSSLAMLEGELGVEMWLPFDYKKNFMNLLSGMQISVITFGVPICYRGLGIKCLVSAMIVYIRDQLVDLQKKIKNLQYSHELNDEMRMNFKIIVKKHIRLIRYSELMKNIYKEYFLIQNLAITIELCLNAIMVILIGIDQKTLTANFIAFLALSLIHAYFYCYLGNELIIQSEGIAVAAYDSPWTSWPIDMQKNLFTLILAAQRPITLTAGGMAPMSLETFALTVYNGYSIFTVLKDVVN